MISVGTQNVLRFDTQHYKGLSNSPQLATHGTTTKNKKQKTLSEPFHVCDTISLSSNSGWIHRLGHGETH